MLSQQKKAEIFTGHQKLAFKMGHKFARHFGINHDTACDDAMEVLGEIIAEGNLPDGREGGRKMTSWLYLQLDFRLRTKYGRPRFVDRIKKFTDVERADCPLTPAAKTHWYDNFVRDLSEDARIIITTIFNAPAEIAEDICVAHRGKARHAIRREMEQRGWPEERVENAWMEIRSCL